jgi:hypothetical protein
MNPILFHFTCRHAAERIGQRGWLLPSVRLMSPLQLRNLPNDVLMAGQAVWLATDRDATQRSLGFDGILSQCDRTEYRYRVTEPGAVRPWTEVRTGWPPEVVAALEEGQDKRPETWWLGRGPMRARLTVAPALTR